VTGPIHRLDRISDGIEIAEIRETLKEATGLLQKSAPDTFLGRKTHDPFPEDHEKVDKRGGGEDN